MTIDIQPVQTTRQRREFVRLARRVNADQPLWVPNLERICLWEITPGKNPFYEHAEAQLFLAYRSGRAIGRIAAIDNRRHNEHWQERVGFFGHYDAIDDPDTSQALFSAAAEWLRRRNLERMRGPTNPSMNASIGFLFEGFEYPPTIPMPYTPACYLRHAEAFGMRTAIEVMVYGWDFDEHYEDERRRVLGRLERLCQRVQGRADIRIRPLQTSRGRYSSFVLQV